MYEPWGHYGYYELRQSQKDKYQYDPTYGVPEEDKFIQTENIMAVARGWRKEKNEELLLSWYRTSVL